MLWDKEGDLYIIQADKLPDSHNQLGCIWQERTMSALTHPSAEKPSYAFLPLCSTTTKLFKPATSALFCHP